MREDLYVLRAGPAFSRVCRPSVALCSIAVMLLASYVACGRAQATAPPSTDAAQPLEDAHAPQPGTHTAAATAKDPTVGQGAFSIQTVGGEIKEDQLKPLLVGKTLYLRAGYQDNNLEFDEHGRLLSHSPKGSYTLSVIQISKVKLSKRKLELDGDRYALHFLGAAPFEDPTAATDRVKITPKKKVVRISFDREQVEKPKSKKEKHKNKQKDSDQAKTANAAPAVADDPAAPQQTAKTSSAAPDDAAQNAGHPSDDKKLTSTASSAHASKLLLAALDSVFSRGIDARMIDAMPDFWKLYYQAAAAKTDFKPSEPGVLRQDTVDQKAKLVSVLDPPSNEFAQANGVAGIAMYHAVVGSDGKVTEVVAGRPIGFGLDESAEQTLRKAVFEPAMKDGKPVPVALDLVVSFRIYSKRTSEPAPQDAAAEKPNQPVLPGPYTAQAIEQAHTNQQSQSPQPPQPAQTPQ